MCKKNNNETTGYEGSIVFTKLKVSGVNVFSAGEFREEDDTNSIRLHDEFGGVYKKLVVRNNKIAGAVLFGDTNDTNRVLSLIRSGEDISVMNKASLLLSESNDNDTSVVAAMGDEETICGCNGVSKGEIVCAIKEQGLSTVAEIRQSTNASRSCGGCKPEVAELLALETGTDVAAKPDPLCGCTELTHEAVVASIREMGLSYVREVMNVLGWKSAEAVQNAALLSITI